MLNKSNVLNELLQLDYTAQAGGNHFNIIDELHANENAHTRILASLLSDKTILHSFLKTIVKLEDKDIEDAAPDQLSIFSDYMDAALISRNFALIIENKIHGAVDQDQQIARYVANMSGYHNKIIVMYLTLAGGKPGPDSFPEECTQKCTLITINYRDHILPWLEKLPVSDQLLSSGLIQYTDHLKGLLGQRKTKDPLSDLKKRLSEKISSGKEAAKIIGEIDYFLGYWRNYLMFNPQLIEQQTENLAEERQRLLLDYATLLFGTIHRDANGWAYLGKPVDCDAVDISIYHWSNISSVQLELYTEKEEDKYEDQLERLSKKLASAGLPAPLRIPFNGTQWLRYPIDNFMQLSAAAQAINGPLSCQLPLAPVNSDDSILKFPVDKLLTLKQCLVELFNRDQLASPWNDIHVFTKDLLLKNGYSYQNGIALHCCWHEQYKYFEAEIWAKDDQKLMYKVWQKLAEQDRIYPFVHYCWRNKTVLIFPIPLTETNDDYAKELCEILKKIKEEITRDHSYLFAEGENNN